MVGPSGDRKKKHIHVGDDTTKPLEKLIVVGRVYGVLRTLRVEDYILSIYRICI